MSTSSLLRLPPRRTSITAMSSPHASPPCAFASCASLASTTLPDGLTSIADYAFYGCTSLALVYVPAGLTSIGFDAFGGTAGGYTSVTTV